MLNGNSVSSLLSYIFANYKGKVSCRGALLLEKNVLDILNLRKRCSAHSSARTISIACPLVLLGRFGLTSAGGSRLLLASLAALTSEAR